MLMEILNTFINNSLDGWRDNFVHNSMTICNGKTFSQDFVVILKRMLPSYLQRRERLARYCTVNYFHSISVIILHELTHSVLKELKLSKTG